MVVYGNENSVKVNPKQGDMYFCTDRGSMFVYCDTDWLEISASIYYDEPVIYAPYIPTAGNTSQKLAILPEANID